MIWKIILLIIVFLLIIPIPIKLKVAFNILRLSGEVQLRVVKLINYKVRVRFRGAYVYVTRNGKTRREKLSSQNYNIAFVMQLINQIYFRTVINSLTFTSEAGYYNNAMTTAMESVIIDVLSKCVYARILHNKKSAHIFVLNEAKYNEDCLNLKLQTEIKISLFDVIYSFINSLISLKGEQYERTKPTYEQNQELD